MEKLKKYLFCTVLTGTLILILVVSAGDWIVNAGNDGKSLEDYTTPTKITYYDTDYYEADHLFGAAGHFHLFASDEISLKAHCNGNFAAPGIDIGANTGTNQVETDKTGEREMSYADKIKHNGLEIKTADLALGKNNTSVTDMNGNTLSSGSIPGNQIKINGTTMNIKEYQKIYLAPDKFIDFTQEFSYLRDVSAALTKLDTTLKKGEKSNANQTGTYNLEDNNAAYIYLADGVNVLNCTLSEVSAAGRLNIDGMLCNKNSNVEKHAFTGTQSLIINVDCKGATTASPGLETDYHCQCAKWPHSHGESNYYPGTIVIWNFYDSSKADKIYTGTVSPSKVIDGCYLAPNADIIITQNANGTLIGKKVTIQSGESHRADFKGKTPDLDLSKVTPTKAPSASPKPTATASAKPTATASAKPSAKPTATASTKPNNTAAPSQEPEETPTVPDTTETPATQTPKETPQATVPSNTAVPNQPTETPKDKTKDKTPSDKNNKKTPKKGNLHITVTDSQTGAVVPNATVKITKPNGKVKTYTTNKKGQIKLNKTPVGKYKGVVTKVPKGYHADRTKFDSKVKAARTTKEKVRIKTAVSASRKKTGTTTTSKTTSKVSSNTTTTNTSQPKTGDNFDVRIPIVLFLLAFIGIISAVILKKRAYY